MQQKPRKKAKRWLVWSGGIVLVFLLAAGGFWYWINIPPQVIIPTPVMPKPNGYDFFLRAGAACVESYKGVDEINDIHYVAGKHYPIAAKETWLSKNAKALRLLREGLKYPALYPARSGNFFPRYDQFRDLMRMLVVESHIRAERGDWPGAADSILDDLEFGYDIQRGGTLISGSVGSVVQNISLRELPPILPHLDAKAASQTAKCMEQFYDGRFPYFRSVQEEKWKVQADLLEMMGKRDWLQDIFNELELSQSEEDEVFFTSKRTLMNNYTKGMDATIANARLPYSKMPHVSTSSDPLMKNLIPDNGIRWDWAHAYTNSALIMTMLALRAFRLEKGHYPANLKELAPQYLKKVPIDPFAGDAPLYYRLQGQKYVLWSIGPDGVDNHGALITNNKKGRGHLFFPDSKGDIVAGINMP
jgi:hypothetical protein